MAQPYWISKENGKFYLHFKVSQPAGSKRQYIIAKDSNYSPEIPDNFWDFFDHFPGNSLNTNKWNDSNASSYSVSDSKLNMWNNWGSCCNGGCYYDGIETNQTFDLPLQIRVAMNQDPYQAASNCGKTGVSVAYKSSAQAVCSTDTNDNMGIALRIDNNGYSNLNVTHMPDITPDNFGWSTNITPNRVRIFAYWDDNKGDFEVQDNPTYTTNRSIVISGDTDSSTVVDHLDYIAIAESKDRLPIINIIDQTNTSMLIEVDDSSTNDGVDLNNLILTMDVTGFINVINEGLNIYNSSNFILFENPNDNNVYYWDGSWNNLNKTKDQLTASDFQNYGSLNIVNINKSNWDSLNNILNVLVYTDQIVQSASVEIKFQPNNRLVIQNKAINLKDFTAIKQMNITINNNNISETDFYCLISRDNNEWFKWDGSQFTSVGNRTLDINNDIDWVINNGVNIRDYQNPGASDWDNFFGNQSPDQIYFAIAINYDSVDNTPEIDKIEVVADTNEYWFDDTKSHTIKYTENNINITFNGTGVFKINYTD